MDKDYLAVQERQRARVFAAHQRNIDTYWNDDGTFAYAPAYDGGYRAILWECLAYLAGDAHCVEKANAIILANYMERPCHFTPGAILDVLFHYRDRLRPEVVAQLEHYLRLHVPYMSTDDLKIHGYNDNHPYKAMHALIVGGELLGDPFYIEKGLFKLRQAIEVFQRNGFPCEYNSPTYTPVSLCPLSCIVEQAKNEEARALALKLEHFYWQDLALHFDPRAGVPAGPFSRAYANDYDGLVGNVMTLVPLLFPERFDFDVVEELFDRAETSPFIYEMSRRNLPFYQAHPCWLASATYNLTPEIERALFEKPAGTVIRGTTESGTGALDWSNDPAKKPVGAPAVHALGPRHGAITTYFGERFSLGTGRYSFLDNGQTHNFYITVAKGAKAGPQHAAVYYASMYFDERCPSNENRSFTQSFRQDGDIRTLQHEGTALVFYNPLPYFSTFKTLRTGIFRPMRFSKPNAIFVGETEVRNGNHIGEKLDPIAIDEGDVYMGFIPLRLTNHGLARRCDLHIHDYAGHLVINMFSFEGWGPRTFTYQQIVETYAGFVCELQPASAFADFAAFRRWLADAHVSDILYGDARTTIYERSGLKLSAAYGAHETMFRYTSINNAPVADPPLSIEGIPDPGYSFVLPSR